MRRARRSGIGLPVEMRDLHPDAVLPSDGEDLVERQIQGVGVASQMGGEDPVELLEYPAQSDELGGIAGQAGEVLQPRRQSQAAHFQAFR